MVVSDGSYDNSHCNNVATNSYKSAWKDDIAVVIGLNDDDDNEVDDDGGGDDDEVNDDDVIDKDDDVVDDDEDVHVSKTKILQKTLHDPGT